MGHKVLLADDSITVQKIVKLSLTEEGIEVIALGNGEQAVQQLESIQPDLVMADVFMPGKDGYEVCEFVKAHPQFKHTPVILLVHAFEPFDPDRAQKVNADQQLTKPFQSIRTLVTTVRDLLSNPQSSTVVVEDKTEETTTVLVGESALASAATSSESNQPEAEFAVVSSLSAAATAMAESESVVSETRVPELTLPPISLNSLNEIPTAEVGLPIPVADSDEMTKTDFMPPLELSVLPPTDWQSVPATMTETANLEFSAASLSAISLSPTPVTASEGTEDVLDLSDVLSANQVSTPTTPEVAASFSSGSSGNEVPLLAVLPTVVAEPELAEEVLADGPQPISDDTSFAQSFDVGVGQIDLTAPVPMAEPVSPGEEVKPDVVADTNTAMPISEAVIEEIVNRVIQRLSTQAVQEIAWEVVPEMAELLIRKQLSQHPRLSH